MNIHGGESGQNTCVVNSSRQLIVYNLSKFRIYMTSKTIQNLKERHFMK